MHILKGLKFEKPFLRQRAHFRHRIAERCDTLNLHLGEGSAADHKTALPIIAAIYQDETLLWAGMPHGFRRIARLPG